MRYKFFGVVIPKNILSDSSPIFHLPKGNKIKAFNEKKFFREGFYILMLIRIKFCRRSHYENKQINFFEAEEDYREAVADLVACQGTMSSFDRLYLHQ